MKKEKQPNAALDLRVDVLLNEFGPAELLRAITRLAHGRYEKMSRAHFERYIKKPDKQRARENRFDYEPPRKERLERDIASAWLCLDVEYAANSFERQMAVAGMSNKERCERNRKEEIEKLERELEWKKQIKCA